MANLFRQNPLVLGLAILAALLIVVIAVEASFGGALWPAQAVPAARTAPVMEAKMLPPIASVAPEQAYPESAARPLFTPTRRPAPTAPTVANTMVKGQFTLQAVFAIGDQRIALLREKSGKVHRVERGKEINGVTLAAVANDQVTLAQGGDQEVLTLNVQRGPATVAAASGATSGPFGPMGAPSQPGGPGAPGAPGAQPPGAPPASVAATPQMPQPAVAAQAPGTPAANPAQRSGFGPFTNQPQAGGTTEATPMTPEELLARRRARRGQQQPQN